MHGYRSSDHPSQACDCDTCALECELDTTINDTPTVAAMLAELYPYDLNIEHIAVNPHTNALHEFIVAGDDPNFEALIRTVRTVDTWGSLTTYGNDLAKASGNYIAAIDRDPSAQWEHPAGGAA